MQTKMHGNKKTSSENISTYYLAAVCSVLVFVPHIEALGPSKAVQLRAAAPYRCRRRIAAAELQRRGAVRGRFTSFSRTSLDTMTPLSIYGPKQERTVGWVEVHRYTLVHSPPGRSFRGTKIEFICFSCSEF